MYSHYFWVYLLPLCMVLLALEVLMFKKGMLCLIISFCRFTYFTLCKSLVNSVLWFMNIIQQHYIEDITSFYFSSLIYIHKCIHINMWMTKMCRLQIPNLINHLIVRIHLFEWEDCTICSLRFSKGKAKEQKLRNFA